MEDITVTELFNRISNGEQLHIIDVREQFEYNEFNIGAELIPLGTLPDHLQDLNKWKNEEIIIHCKSGMRSANAKAFLAMNGFAKVRNVIGGMLAWQQNGYIGK
jgi:rhodanese-related sulfurtransferase